MHRYRDRLILLHLKDIKAEASPETRATCFVAVGEGAVNLVSVLKAAQTGNIMEHGIIIDQDDSEGDILDDIALGVKNIQMAMKAAANA